MEAVTIGALVTRRPHATYGHTDTRFTANAPWRVAATQLDGALATLELLTDTTIRCAASVDSLAPLMEIAIIHESSIGDDDEDVTEYRAVLCEEDEISRRYGCMNYGAVSRIKMDLWDFQRYMEDGKFSFSLTRLADGAVSVREYDSMEGPEDAVTIHADASGMYDLSPLGWQFYPAARFI